MATSTPAKTATRIPGDNGTTPAGQDDAALTAQQMSDPATGKGHVLGETLRPSPVDATAIPTTLSTEDARDMLVAMQRQLIEQASQISMLAANQNRGAAQMPVAQELPSAREFTERDGSIKDGVTKPVLTKDGYLVPERAFVNPNAQTPR